MSMAHGKYGKDHPENFIEGALRGGQGKSEGLHKYPVDRPHQHILTAIPMDNVKLAYDEETSILDTKFRGGVNNIEHSLTGASAVNDEVGAAGKVHHDIIPNH